VAAERSGGGRRALLLAARFAIAGAVLFYLVRSGTLDWAEVRGVWTSWGTTLLAIGLLCGLMLVASWRLCLLFGPAAFGLTFGASVRLTLIGTFFNTFMPGGGGGDLVRIYYATTGNEGRRTEVVAIMLLDRVVGLASLLLVPLILAPLLWDTIGSDSRIAALVAMSTALGFAVVAALALLVWRGDLAVRVLDRLGRRLPVLGHLERSVRVLGCFRGRAGTLVAGFAVAFAGHALGVGAILSLAAGATSVVPTLGVAAVAPLGFIANALPISPGGIGVGEAAMDALFSVAGHGGGAAAMLGWRLSMMLIGIVGLGVYLVGRRGFVTGGARDDTEAVATGEQSRRHERDPAASDGDP
jgi:hypothetical protein